MISAKVIADTVWDNTRITSLQLHLPKFILAELNTHRVIAKCSASSRAIPTDKIIKMVDEDYFKPLKWGKNKAGMSADTVLNQYEEMLANNIWRNAVENAIKSVRELQKLNVHKQTINRLLEPFMWVDTICTATEWDNFFNLRISEHAQPEMRALAEAMKEAMDNSTPVARMWHLPYVRKEEQQKDLVDFKISAARCARVSYLKHDQTKPNYAEDLALADKLESLHHNSPFDLSAIHKECVRLKYQKETRQFKDWIPFRVYLEKGMPNDFLRGER